MIVSNLSWWMAALVERERRREAISMDVPNGIPVEPGLKYRRSKCTRLRSAPWLRASVTVSIRWWLIAHSRIFWAEMVRKRYGVRTACRTWLELVKARRLRVKWWQSQVGHLSRNQETRSKSSFGRSRSGMVIFGGGGGVNVGG